ncbi:dihydroxyacetone kinase subunit DhaL [Peribacillus sp. SCS-155]|uniref:dihydroxyacetone kinase subunit DhaL n=1 Tax=Peribacillus sedimenti TaxID=3115297 RepID=UPI003906A18E
MGFGINEAKIWLASVNRKLQEQKSYLTELDQAIGDGDHGLNMARGFKEVINKVQQKSYDDLHSLFKETGMTLLSKVGGASGPLYGTAFLKMASTMTGKAEISVRELADGIAASLEGLIARGKANIGDKTMLDIWEPALHYLQKNQEQVNWDEFMEFLEEKLEETKELEAKKGRAAYLGKRSIGHIDPGSASSVILFNELAVAFKGVKKS